jgi:hypothetical protein
MKEMTMKLHLLTEMKCKTVDLSIYLPQLHARNSSSGQLMAAVVAEEVEVEVGIGLGN